ncbi:MAG: hypothetical protein BAJALOKI2v1_120037 [Promethearchaeota archaeon]|nr:MAG: hypothetical protein BAJALOKI2v1_120037 [Candidatus Lokiarchaeota archaeon]
MVNRLYLLTWNERSGIEIISKYPDSVELGLTKRDFFQIYNMHQYSPGKKGIVSLTLNSINFISYYGGPESEYYVVLVLNILENPDDFEEIMEEVALEVLDKIEQIENDEENEILKNIFIENFGKSTLKSVESEK